MRPMAQDPEHRRRGLRLSGGRFFITAVLVAVVIFAVVEAIQYEFRSHPAAQSSKTPVNATAAIASASDSLQGFEVVLWHKGCSAGCPDYALHYKDGLLHYTGIREVAKKGNVSTSFDRYHQMKLLELVQKARFFDLGDDYTLKSSKCHPGKVGAAKYVLGVTLNGQTRKITVNEGCTNIPPKLTHLMQGFDKLADADRWVLASRQAPAAATGGSR